MSSVILTNKKSKSPGTLPQNPKPTHHYNIQHTIQPPIPLTPTQIKSIPPPTPNLKHTFPQLTPAQIYLNNIHIPPYQQPNPFNHHPLPTPKLLFHKKQIQKLA
ncbi:SsrA-binding protein, partial [Staphylococcus epidermidis]|uniref:SsrA-binding protein n=1 Tax=Staphylococcus epidermidis TaxID=1282 RepID=UPI0037DA5D60